MGKIIKLTINCAVSAFAIAAMLLLYTQNSVSFAARSVNNERIIRRDRLPREAPIVFYGEQIAGEATFFGKPTSLSVEEILKNYSFKVKNITNRNIKHLGLSLSFPDTKETEGAEMSFNVDYGSASVYDTSGRQLVIGQKGSALNIAPGDNLKVELVPHYNEITNFLKTRKQQGEIKTIVVRVNTAHFEDGTQWAPSAGYTKYDAQQPGRQIRVAVPELMQPSKIKELVEKEAKNS